MEKLSPKLKKKYGTMEKYKAILKQQQSPEYKLKRNARIRKKRTEDNVREELSKIIESEVSLRSQLAVISKRKEEILASICKN